MNNTEAYARRLETKLRNKVKHSGMRVLTFALKIQVNKLSAKTLNRLSMCFVEAKWLRNYIISFLETHNLKEFDRKTVNISHKDKDGNDVEVVLENLSSQMRTAVIDWVKDDLNKLHAKKVKGQKVGRLKYTSVVNSIPLTQYRNTFRFNDDFTKLSLQRFGQKIRFKGGEQIRNLKGDFDIQCAKLIRNAEGYFLHVTVYTEKEETEAVSDEIGIDFGVKDFLTFSNGEKIPSAITGKQAEILERIKTVQRSLSRKVRRSKNWFKTKFKLDKLYQKLKNIKEDISNKLVHTLKNRKNVVIQDEQIHSWFKRFGKKLQHGILGRVKTKLSRLENCHVISKWLPTTQLCPKCFSVHKMPLNVRTYNCECGYSRDRDIHAANNMLLMFHLIHEDYTPEELRGVPADRLNDFKAKWALNLRSAS